MDDHDTNYFVCTLGQASIINAKNPPEYSTVNEFLDLQARRLADLPAVGFPQPPPGADHSQLWSGHVLTFRELQQASIAAALKLQQSLGDSPHSEDHIGCIALLCSSSMDFLLAWLGLMRLGYSVLLIAPQCQPSSISHLCKICNASILVFDTAFEPLAKESVAVSKAISGQVLQGVALTESVLSGDSITTTNDYGKEVLSGPVTGDDIAYLHHTSGTSTGLPKPIPLTHHAAVGVLPRIRTGKYAATFSTTPLYHGGIADCLRCWTSDAMIWLFPNKDVPITVSTVLKSLECADRASRAGGFSNSRYFSSVPYVLQMLAENDKSLSRLQKMDIVGVGGAALPLEVGNTLIGRGVNLISRFGSAECGFLMSSHRAYTSDRAWQYLRSEWGADCLSFETRDQGLSELVVLPKWPHVAKKNRSNGSYATADLFESHPNIPNAWRYDSRADSQLTLSTGKKFDPAPLESTIAIHHHLQDALVFGNGKQYPGALLFPSKDSLSFSDAEILDSVWTMVQKINDAGQGHTKLSRSMLFVMSRSEPALQKSSKGTILRRVAEQEYGKEIESAYATLADEIIGVEQFRSNDEMLDTVLKIVKQVVGFLVEPHVDLFAQGVDSVACMQIRKHLQIYCPPQRSLPLNVVYDCGTVQSLASWLCKLKSGINEEPLPSPINKFVGELITKYGLFNPKVSTTHTILLSGATGSLGAHILNKILKDSNSTNVFCLVRAKNEKAALERVYDSLASRCTVTPAVIDPDRLTCFPCDLASSDLGLSQAAYKEVASRASIIIHAAWEVNFNVRLASFTSQLSGLRNLIDLALSSPNPLAPKVIFVSSTASVLGSEPSSHQRRESRSIDECISDSAPTAPSSTGYAQSKWVAEQICANAHKHTRLKNRISILRVGQLCGDTVNGSWNASEAFPLMLSSVKVTKCLPDKIDSQNLTWLPVDVAAEAIREVAMLGDDYDDYESLVLKSESTNIPVYHILNQNATSWDDIIMWLSKLDVGFSTIPAKDWVKLLEDPIKNNIEGLEDHPVMKLLELWRNLFTGESMEESLAPRFVVKKTREKVMAMRGVNGGVTEEEFGKMWRWIETNV